MEPAMTLNVLPYGPSALLVETGGLAPALIAEELRLLEGVIDAVPGAGTVLLTFETAERSERESIRFFTDQIHALKPGSGGQQQDGGSEVTIPVRYDGADLAAVAELSGMRQAEVIAAHAGGVYRVSFMGFAPGFGYLEGLPSPLHLPRRETPRTHVPTGAVAIAGPYTAVYPRQSPGGWLLLGSTEIDLFDVSARPPARLRPGMRVRFEPV